MFVFIEKTNSEWNPEESVNGYRCTEEGMPFQDITKHRDKTNMAFSEIGK